MKLNEKSKKRIDAQTSEAIKALGEGRSVRDVLTDLYMRGMPDKTEEQGQMMADRIIELVEAYEEEVKKAFDDEDQWIHEKLDEILKDKSLEERCNILYKMIHAVQALGSMTLTDDQKGEEADIEAYMARCENCVIDSAVVCEELEENMQRLVIEGLKDSGLVFMQMGHMADTIEELKEGEDFLQFFLAGGIEAVNTMAVTSMITYVDAKNGIIEEVPLTATIEEITFGVCAAIKTERIAAEVAANHIEEEVARKFIRIVGMVASAMVIGYFSILLGTTVAYLFGGMLSLAAAIAVGAITFNTIWDATAELRCKLENGMGNVVVAGVKKVTEVLRRIYGWFVEQGLPAARSTIKRGWAYINNLGIREQREQASQEEMVTNMDEYERYSRYEF